MRLEDNLPYDETSIYTSLCNISVSYVKWFSSELLIHVSSKGCVLSLKKSDAFPSVFRGTEEYFGLDGRVTIINSTLGKALGGAAGLPLQILIQQRKF